MSIKHALVVDDSRAARVALKTQLEQHELAVELAESGEEALEFLKHDLVDVIFMDHTMPGMDGLEALTVIKSIPRTATIPVMMYTSKEGEVYVGQARALGAIGVLPKEVHPGELFQTLHGLGLVKDKRTKDVEPSVLHEADERRGTQSSPGMTVEALVTRILQDQHLLRADLLRSHRDFAKSVAAEIVEEQRAAPATPPAEAEPPPKPDRRIAAAAGLFALATLILAILLWQTRAERDAAVLAAERMTAAEEELATARASSDDLRSTFDAERGQSQAQFLRLVSALQWALNQGSHPYDLVAFDDARAEELRAVLSHLVTVGFKGTVRLESHLGEFCLVNDESGTLRPAAPDSPIEACMLVGHPLDNSSFVSDRQSVAFADFLDNSPLVNEAGIDVQVVAHDRSASRRLHAFAPDLGSAGEWNAIAQTNNRVEYSLTPAAPTS